MTEVFKPGDRVLWNSPQGRIAGEVVRRQTERTHIKGHPVDASPEAPQYIVRSDSTGALAAHKPEALTRR